MLLAGRVRGAAPARRRARRASWSTGSGCATSRARSPTSSRAASSSASRSPARSSTTRRCCSPTSRPATSTPRPAPRCCGCCAQGADEGRAVVMVTHEAGATAMADRVLRLDDGQAGAVLSFALAGLRARGARTLLSAAGDARRVAGGRHGRDGRLRARDRLRALRRPRRPARRDRALRRRAARDGRRAGARAAQPRRPPPTATSALDAPTCAPTAATRDRGARAAPSATGRRGYEIVEGRDLVRRAPARWWSSAGWRRSGTWSRATSSTSAAASARSTIVGVARLARQRRLPARHDRARLRRASDDPRSGSASCPTTPTSRCCGSTTRARPT